MASATIQMNWDDVGFENNRPQSIQVTLYRNNNVYQSSQLTAANGWSVTWNNLQNYYTWSFGRVSIDKYDTTQQTSNSVTTIYATYNGPRYTTHKVIIEFIGDEKNFEDRPEQVTVQLYRNNMNAQYKDIKGPYIYQYEWENLIDGYSYTVFQNAIDCYETTITDEQLVTTIVNKYIGKPKPPQPPPPHPGDHPTKSDFDLMYSILYDDNSITNALDIIHVLDYGVHGPNYVE